MAGRSFILQESDGLLQLSVVDRRGDAFSVQPTFRLLCQLLGHIFAQDDSESGVGLHSLVVSARVAKQLFAIRTQPCGGRELQGAAVRQSEERLHRTFSKCLLADHSGAMVIL